ncbi:uncharacterized protein LOC123668727 [Melitaea cinxia]|uniref:uncharacterized protein LOC123668727 n=1 Tax=Melitaea cinxia TaxID=113334 RepID=UPI001E26F78C|nr:uncharacterized protein LOC123668727 [Melitaea cinxia]
MGSFLYFVIFAVTITNSFAIEAVPLNCFFRNHNFMNKCSADAVNASPGDNYSSHQRFGVLKFDSHSVNKDEWVLELKNIEIRGMDNAILDDYSFNFVTKNFQITFHTDLFVTYNYFTSGFLFSRPISGEGFLEAPIKDIQIGLSMPFDFVEKNGHTFMELKNFDMWYNIRDKILFDFSNLYYGDKKSSDLMHSLMDKNWNYIVTNFGIEFMDKMGNQIFQVFRKVMLSQPFDSSNC